MNNFDVLLGMKLGGGGGSSTLVEKTITANGTYNPADDNADGYSSVTANVPNTYTVADEGKVVDSGALVGQTAKNIDANGLYDTTLNNSVNVSVPNSYTVADEGKVVSSGALVSQTATTCDSNGTIDTTLNNSVVVNVPNSYSASDEGKVVSSGALVSQTSRTVSQNGTYDTTLNSSVIVNVPPVGVVLEKDVNFYDYDGTLLYSYTAQEFLALSELPANPTHNGLTAQGWNWTLADAQAWVTSYGYVDIGQLYITDDGKTRLYINIESEYDKTVGIGTYCTYNGNNQQINFDWGDGTTSRDSRTARTHTYANTGKYTITIDYSLGTGTITKRVILGGFNNTPLLYSGTWAGSSDWSTTDNVLEAVELGAGIGYFNGFVIRCTRLKTCTMPTGNFTLNSNMFGKNFSLQHINIPNVQFESYVYDSNDGIGLQDCLSLKKVCYPKNAYLHSTGNNGLFNLSHALSLKQKIPYWEGTTYFDLRYLDNYFLPIPNGCVTIQTYAFAYRRLSEHEVDVVIPNTVTTIEQYAFTFVWNVKSLTIPNSVTSISSYCFQYADVSKLICDNVGTIPIYFADSSHLREVEIGNSITRIRSYAFSKCYMLNSIKFLGSTPPTVDSSDAWYYLPTTCKIYVPTGSLTAYTTAANYPNPSTYTYVEY